MNEQKQGINATAAAEGALGNKEAAIQQQAQKQLQTQLQSYQENLKQRKTERAKLQADISTRKIDPQHYIGSMSTSEKLSMASALIPAGIGAGAMGQQNPALAYLNKQIDNDIEAQKANLNKKQSLLSANQQQYGNLQEATSVT